MDEVFDKIEKANDHGIRDIMDAVQEQIAIAYPHWEIVYIAVPKDDPIRRGEMLKQVMTMLDKESEEK